MADLGTYRCHHCHMAFRSLPLLEKHKEKFCLGGQTGDPTILSSHHVDTERTTYLPARGAPRMAETPNFSTRDSYAQLRAREELLNEREQQLMGLTPRGSMSDSRALRNLTEEFHKLRKSLEVSVPTLKSYQFQDGLSLHSPWDREFQERMQEMAEAHERQLADIQARNQTLELQREEIRQRISEVTNAGSSANQIEQILLELKAQEEKNQLALDDLRDQVGLIQSESRAKTEKSSKEREPSAPGKKEKPTFPFLAFPAHSSCLSSEISALQLAYIQSGGNDSAVLVQMRDLQAEALVLEGTAQKQERKERKKKRHDGVPRVLDAELMAVEMENQRLEEEIFKLTLQREKKKAANGEAEMMEMHREHAQQMAQLQVDIGMLRRDVSRLPPRALQGPPPFVPPMAPPVPPNMHLTRQPPGRPEATIVTGGVESMRPPSPSAKRHTMEPLDALGPAPYDPVAGFVIFYDFLLGLETTYQTVRLLSGLYSNGHRMGQATSLPDVPCEMWHPAPHLEKAPKGNTAMLAAKQPIPRVRPASSIALVVELQASGGFNPYGQEVQHVSSCGWSKLDLFDQHNQVLSGRWKLPVRALPLRPGLNTGQLNTVPQVGKAELYVRVVNARDAELQSLAEIDPRNASLYQYPPLISGSASAAMENPTQQLAFHRAPNTFNLSLSPYTDYVDPPPVEELPKHQRNSQRVKEPAEEGEKVSSDEEHTQTSVGFIIDRVKDVPVGDGTLRLTGYHMKTGQVIRTRGSGMNCVIAAVSSNVKHGHFIFGEQEVLFRDVNPEEDLILILRFYHWPVGSAAWSPWQHRRSLEPLPASEEWMVAWAALHLTRSASSEAPADMSRTRRGGRDWNTGIQDLPLFHAPAPPAPNLSAILPEDYEKAFEQYGNARARFCVFSASRPDFPFLPESPLVGNPIPRIPEGVFIRHSRPTPPSDPHPSSDCIALHIDGARFLPDAVTVSWVTGRIFDKNFDQFGPDICTDIDLNSDIFQPFYNFSRQIRSPTLPPTATLLLKVYTIDRFARGLSLIGWAALNLFVESGSEKVPTTSDQGDVTISLNEGAHQIRIYHRAPPTDRPFCVESLASSGRVVPCATLLVRLMKAENDVNLPSTQKDGDLHPVLQRPLYSMGIYYSDSAQPRQGEIQLYLAMMNRSVVLVKEAILSLAGSERHTLVSNQQLSHWVQKTFTEQMTESTHPFNLSCVSQYLTTSGIKVSADRAQNLPWSGLTLAHICLNPPGAFYLGYPWLKYDQPVPVDNIDLNSHQKCPAWQDGVKTFTHRPCHKTLTALFQLHEIVLSRDPERNGSGAGEATRGSHPPQALTPGVQAWTALQIFYQNYCNMGVYQLPLYHGAPTRAALQALSSADCAAALKDLAQKQRIKLVPGASLMVRMADGRRFQELEAYDSQDINQSHLPEESADLYTRTLDGEKIADLILDKQEDFKKDLSGWFRKHLYSLNVDSTTEETMRRYHRHPSQRTSPTGIHH